jgi:hypothetical protein
MLSMSTKERSVEQEHGRHETSQLKAKSVMKKDIPVIAGGALESMHPLQSNGKQGANKVMDGYGYKKNRQNTSLSLNSVTLKAISEKLMVNCIN